MKKNETVTILQRLHTNRQDAKKFVADPAAEWQALGGKFPPGVTPAQFSKRMRSSPVFKDVEAVANGKMSAMSWSPCVTGVVFLFGILGIGTAAAAGAFVAPIAVFLAADATVVAGIIAAAGQVTIIALATALCHGL